MRVIKIVDKKVSEVKQVLGGYILASNEMESEIGELGQIMQQDGTFIDAPMEQITPQPTLEEMAEETLLETKYQTALLEMMGGI